MTPKRTLGLTLAAGSLALLLAGCGKPTSGAEPDPTAAVASTAPTQVVERKLMVGLTEWAVSPDKRAIPAGAVTIIAANLGKTPHDLVIVRTDAGPKDLAVVDDRADETKLKIVGRFQEFKSGEKEKQFALDAGKYLLICNILTHYEEGMVAQLTVE